MSFLRLKLGRKIDGDCPGVGRDPMLVRATRRREVMQLRMKMLRSRYHRQCKIKVETLSNVDEYDNVSLEIL